MTRAEAKRLHDLLRVGDIVEWESQAAGTWRAKCGRIVRTKIRGRSRDLVVQVEVPVRVRGRVMIQTYGPSLTRARRFRFASISRADRAEALLAQAAQR